MTKSIAQESETNFPGNGDPAENALAKLAGKARAFLVGSGLAEALARAANLFSAPGAFADPVFEDGDIGRDAAHPVSAFVEKKAGGRNVDAFRTGENPSAKNGCSDQDRFRDRRRPAQHVGRDGGDAAARRYETMANASPGPGLLNIAVQAVGQMFPHSPLSLFGPETNGDAVGEGGERNASGNASPASAPFVFSSTGFLSSNADFAVDAEAAAEPRRAAAESQNEERAIAVSSGANGGGAHNVRAGGSLSDCFSQAVGALSRGVGAAEGLAGDWPFSPSTNIDACGGGTGEGGDAEPGAPGPAMPSAASAWNEIASAMGLRPETATEWAECGGAAAGLYDVSQTFFQGAPLPDGNGGTTSITTNLSLGDLNVTVPGGDGRDIADTLATELQGRLADLGDIVVHDADGAAKR